MNVPPHSSVGRWLLAITTVACFIGCYGRTTSKESSNAPPSPPDYSVAGQPFEAAPLKLRALLSWQYRNAIRDLLGSEAASVVTPPADITVNGWDAIGAAELSMSATAVDLYELSAQRAAAAAMNNPETRDAVLGCGTPNSAEDCLRSFVARFGRRVWRRPLSEEDVSNWSAVAINASAGYGDLYKGAAFAIAGLLESPYFLYQIEVGEPDSQDLNRRRLTGYEMATRLSFFLAGSTPSDDLLTAAENGDLDSEPGVRAWAQRLLESSGARDAVSHWFDEHLQLRDLAQMSKDPNVFPNFRPAVASAMHEETQRFLASLIWDEDTDFRRFFNAGYSFVNRDLASLYDLPDTPAGDFARVELPSGRRAGFLGQASFLSLMAHPASTSPTLRGKFIREKILCQNIPPPPPNVDTTLPESLGVTARERLIAHRQNPSCSSCHRMMDDIGLGLENFDALGRYRDTEQGETIDASSQLDALGTFAGAKELGDLLQAEPRATMCLIRNLFRAATGHVDTAGELGPLTLAHERFAVSGFRLKQALVEIAASEAFRFGAKGSEP